MTLYMVTLSLAYVEIKSWAVGKIQPFQELGEYWSEWEVRCLVVLSLSLQLLLILSAYGRQKYKGRCLPYAAALVWSIYLGADWVATLSMTTILRGTFEKESAVVVLWVPFLLWHLGSPANITAYSLEDNELWLRHFLGLASNGVEAVYIYLKFRTVGARIHESLYHLDLMVVLLLVCGILKYAERIVALRSASSEQLRNTLYSDAERSQLKSNDGRRMIRTGLYEPAEPEKETDERHPQLRFLGEAYKSFEIFKPLFLDLPFEVSIKYHREWVFLKNKTAEEAFWLVNIELQFLYDLFFTKNPIQHRYRKVNAFLRGLYILSPLYVLIVFSAQDSIGSVSKRDMSRVDITITYMLLVGALFLDVFAVVLHIWSYWTMALFGGNTAGSNLHKLYKWLVASKLRSITSKSGIPKIAQHDILKDFFSKSWIRIFSPLINLIDPNEVVSKYGLITWVEADSDLKEFIYSGLKKELRGSLSRNVPVTWIVNDLDASLWPYLEHGKDVSKQMPASLTRAIFICHITTMLFYYSDFENEGPGGSSLGRTSKILSDYMLYLVLVHPTMLPKEFGDMTKESFIPDKKRPDLIREKIRIIASEVTSLHPHAKLNPTKIRNFVTTQLLHRDKLSQDFDLNDQDVYSVGVRFAIQLRDSCSQIDGGIWGLLSDLWMKMLFHAAKECSWKEHAVALMNGGELFTHVSLLSAHLGLSYYIGIQQADPEPEIHNDHV